MSNSRSDKIKEYIAANKKTVLLFTLFLFGILMLTFSSSFFSQKSEAKDVTELAEYKKNLEEELVQICSSVRGVGKCRVMVTFERGEENVYKGSVLIESRPPKVMGVTVVCKGADSDAVRSEITDMMMALFDIGANRVSVLKFNS